MLSLATFADQALRGLGGAIFVEAGDGLAKESLGLLGLHSIASIPFSPPWRWKWDAKTVNWRVSTAVPGPPGIPGDRKNRKFLGNQCWRIAMSCVKRLP